VFAWPFFASSNGTRKSVSPEIDDCFKQSSSGECGAESWPALVATAKL